MRRTVGLAALPIIELLERRLHCSASAVTDFHSLGAVAVDSRLVIPTTTLATFHPTLPIDHYSAKLSWSGEEETGKLEAQPDGTLAVVGGHTFDYEYAYSNVSIEIDADGVSQQQAFVYFYRSMYVYANYQSDPEQMTPPPTIQSLHPMVGQSNTLKLGELMGEPGFTSASDYTVQIDWGDGTAPSHGTLTPNAHGQNTYDIGGEHVFPKAGRFDIKYTITAPDGAHNSHSEYPDGEVPFDRASLQVFADADGGNPDDGESKYWFDDFDKVLPAKDGSFSGVIAHVTGKIPAIGDYDNAISIDMDWGDSNWSDTWGVWHSNSQPGDNEVTVQDDGKGGFFIIGSHTFNPEFLAESGQTSFGVEIDINAGYGNSLASAYRYAVLSSDAITFLYPPTAWLDADQQTGTLEVDRFYDPNPGNISDYTATIDWQDGTPVEAGIVTYGDGTDHTGDNGVDWNHYFGLGGDNTFHIRGLHRYSDAGGEYYPIVKLTKRGNEPIDGMSPDIAIFGNQWPDYGDDGSGGDDGGDVPPPVVDPPVVDPPVVSPPVVDPPVVSPPVVSPPTEEPTPPPVVVENPPPPTVEENPPLVEKPLEEPAVPVQKAEPFTILPPKATSSSEFFTSTDPAKPKHSDDLLDQGSGDLGITKQ